MSTLKIPFSLTKTCKKSKNAGKVQQMEEITQEFPDWTTYDNWLIKNNNNYSITSLNEVNGKIVAVYFDKQAVSAENGENNGK